MSSVCILRVVLGLRPPLPTLAGSAWGHHGGMKAEEGVSARHGEDPCRPATGRPAAGWPTPRNRITEPPFPVVPSIRLEAGPGPEEPVPEPSYRSLPRWPSSRWTERPRCRRPLSLERVRTSSSWPSWTEHSPIQPVRKPSAFSPRRAPADHGRNHGRRKDASLPPSHQFRHSAQED